MTYDWVSASTRPACEDGGSVAVWLLIDDTEFPETYIRELGYWIENVELMTDEALENITVCHTASGFYTVEDNYVTPADGVVSWQYLPDIPIKPT